MATEVNLNTALLSNLANRELIRTVLQPSFRDLQALPFSPQPVRQPQPLMPVPVSPTPASPSIVPVAAVPPAATSDVFDTLPFPSPGDRIRSDDIKALSQSLRLLHDALALSGALVGMPVEQAKMALAGQGYQIVRVMSVFGSEIADFNDPALNARRVVQAIPIEPGMPQVALIVTETVEVQRLMPNLIGLTYADASERLQGIMGDIVLPDNQVNADQLIGLTLTQAQSRIQS